MCGCLISYTYVLIIYNIKTIINLYAHYNRKLLYIRFYQKITNFYHIPNRIIISKKILNTTGVH